MRTRLPLPGMIIKLHCTPGYSDGNALRLVAVSAVASVIHRRGVKLRIFIVGRIAVVDILLPQSGIAGACLAVYKIADLAACKGGLILNGNRCGGTDAARAEGRSCGTCQIAVIGEICSRPGITQPADDGAAIIAASVLNRAVVIAIVNFAVLVVKISHNAADIAARRSRFDGAVIGAVADIAVIDIPDNSADAVMGVKQVYTAEEHAFCNPCGSQFTGYTAHMHQCSCTVADIHI